MFVLKVILQVTKDSEKPRGVIFSTFRSMCSKVVHKTDILKRKLKNSQRNTCAQVSFSARLQAAELKPNLKIIHLKETAMGNSLLILWNISEQISPGAPLGGYFFLLIKVNTLPRAYHWKYSYIFKLPIFLNNCVLLSLKLEAKPIDKKNI